MAAKLALLAALSFPQVLTAEEFSGHEFLQWESASQDAYLQNVMIMAALVSSRTSPAHGDCISGWFFDDDGIRPQRQEDAMEQISEFREFRPSAVLVAMIESACGPFGLTN